VQELFIKLTDIVFIMLIVATAYKYFHFILRILFRVILSLTVNLNKYQANDSSSYSWIIDRGLCTIALRKYFYIQKQKWSRW